MSQPSSTSSISQIGAVARRPTGGGGGDTLADVLERVLDKGVVIVGDIGISVLDIELLTLKVRLLIASAETAREMGIDWWTNDPYYNSAARKDSDDTRKDSDETRELRDRVAELERRLAE